MCVGLRNQGYHSFAPEGQGQEDRGTGGSDLELIQMAPDAMQKAFVLAVVLAVPATQHVGISLFQPLDNWPTLPCQRCCLRFLSYAPHGRNSSKTMGGLRPELYGDQALPASPVFGKHLPRLADPCRGGNNKQSTSHGLQPSPFVAAAPLYLAGLAAFVCDAVLPRIVQQTSLLALILAVPRVSALACALFMSLRVAYGLSCTGHASGIQAEEEGEPDVVFLRCSCGRRTALLQRATMWFFHRFQ